MYELDYLSRKWVPDGWTWNSQKACAEPINGARVDLTSTGCEQASGRPTIQCPRMRPGAREVHQAGHQFWRK